MSKYLHTTTVVWRFFHEDPPTQNEIILIAEWPSVRDTDDPYWLSVYEAEVDDGKIVNSHPGTVLTPDDMERAVYWAPIPEVRHLPPRDDARPTFTAPELWQAITRGGFDLTLCKNCSKPIVCLPDGMGAYCEGCAP